MSDIENFPEEAQEYIRKLRGEAAQYRTERNEYRDKYADAGSALKEANTRLDEFSAFKDTAEKLSTDLAQKSEAHDRLFAAAKYKLEPEDAGRLQGSNAEEWLKDAEGFASRVTGKPAGVPKNPGAGAPPEGGTPPNEDGITKAFRAAGLL